MIAPVVVAVLAAASVPSEREAAAKKVTEVLAQPRYAFCRDPKYPLFPDETDWCRLVVSGRCEALPEACRAGPQKPAVGCDLDAEPGAASRPRLGGLGLPLLWALVIGSAIMLLRLVVSRVLAGTGESEAPAKATELPVTVAPERAPVETDVDRLLAMARAEAARGENARAVDHLYAALLRRLEGDGAIRVRPFRTNGDYVRDLREKRDLQREVRDIVRTVERVQFGADAATAEGYVGLLARVLPLVGRAVAIFLVTGLLVGLWGCSRVPGWRGERDDTPSGTRAVVEVLEGSGIDVRRRFQSLAKLGDDDRVVVLLPHAHVEDRMWPGILKWVDGGGGLVIAGGSRKLPEEIGVKLVEGSSSNHKLTDLNKPPLAVSVPGGSHLEIDQDLDADVGDVDVLLRRGERPYAASVVRPKGWIFLLADARLFENASLAVADNAAFLVRTFKRYEGIQFADEATGGASNPFATLAGAHLGPFLAQLALLVVLLFAHRGVPFGAPRDPPVESRRHFADHVRALGLAYAKARASRHALSLYSTWAMERLRERVRLGENRGSDALAAAVAARTGRTVEEVTALFAATQRASYGPGTAEDLLTLGRLARLLGEIGGAR